MAVQLPAAVARYSVRHDHRMAHITLGLVWFAALLLAFPLGTFVLAVVFGSVATLAALQVAQRWQKRRVKVNNLLAGLLVLLSVIASLINVRFGGVVLIVGAVAAVLLGSDLTKVPNLSGDAAQKNLAIAAATLRSGLAPAIASVAVIAMYRGDAIDFLFLMSAVCVYDAGDFLISYGYRTPLAGPIAGMIGVLFVTISTIQIRPDGFSTGGVITAGIVMALACPAGTFLGSWMLPSARTAAPALRRIDSWLLAAPLFLIATWL